MITNFDYLKKDSKFSRFADVAISAEKIILMDPEASILNSRRAMEFAIKWMYSVDSELEMPYQDNLQSLMNAEEYRQIVGPDLWKRMDYIRRSGNSVAHNNKKLGVDEAMLCLENLFIYLDYIAYCYSTQYEEHSFDKTIITSRIEKAKKSKEAVAATKNELEKEQQKSAKQELDLKKLIAENASLRDELSARRQEQQLTYVPKPLDLSEYKTRKLYIDSMLTDAGWTEGEDWLNEVELSGMPNKSETGFADYVFQGLLDGEDKEKFYIFDFCGNFEFFRMNKGKATANMMALQGAIFNLKFEISYKLQDIEYQIDRLVAYRKALVMQMSEKVRELPRDNFAVRQHLKYVDLYSSEENYNALTYEDTLIVKEEVAPLILSDGDEASAVRFDALMYGIELAYLAGKKYSRARSDLHKKIAGIASVANIPEIQAQTDLINKVLNTDYVDTAGINEFEEIREKLRNLMKYLPNSSIRYDTNFTDEVLSTEWNESELENDDLKNYKAKAEYYIRQHQDNIAIAKLKRNKPLTSTDIAMLEEVLWSEVGTKQDYEQEFGEKPLGEFVREIVGLDMNAAKEAFSEYLTNASLDSRQIYFVNQIVEYIVHNGMMKDLSVLQESPFTDRGSVVEIFTDLSVWMGIRKVIDMINANAVA